MNLGMKEVINGSTHSLQVSFQVLRFSSVTTILPTVALLLLHATLVRRTSEHLGNYSQSDTLQKIIFCLRKQQQHVNDQLNIFPTLNTQTETYHYFSSEGLVLISKHNLQRLQRESGVSAASHDPVPNLSTDIFHVTQQTLQLHIITTKTYSTLTRIIYTT